MSSHATANAVADPALAEAFAGIIQHRKSVRAFQPHPVPRPVLERIFQLCNHTPSNCNTQPWVVHVASGAPLETLRKAIPDLMMNGVVNMDFPYDGKYSGVYKERQVGAAESMFGAMGIAREDKLKRNEAFMRNFVFFDAPHVAFLFIPDAFSLREAVDIGMYAQSLMLALDAHGLGSCPQTSLGFHADLVRETLGVDPSLKLLFGISFGYEDTSAAVNACRTLRAPIEDNTFFHD
jgi:nitroreductase